MPRRTASCVAFIHIQAVLLLLLLILIFPKLAVYLWPTGREKGGGESPETATLNNISSAKVFLRLVPFFLCPHNEKERERGKKRRRKNEKKTLRAEREWEWEIQAKLLRVRVPVEPCQTNQHHTIPTTPTKQTENELTVRYLGYSIRLGNKRNIIYKIFQKKYGIFINWNQWIINSANLWKSPLYINDICILITKYTNWLIFYVKKILNSFYKLIIYISIAIIIFSLQINCLLFLYVYRAAVSSYHK